MASLDDRFQLAVQQFWTGRTDALQRQINAGKVDAGSRGSVTAGGHMSSIEALVVDLLEEAGLDRLDVRTKAGLALPGYFRPEKKWDLLVVSNQQLLLAIEFKSQVGSVGNNFNNRTEEAIGNATDIWTAFREGRLGTFRPFLGYFFLLEDSSRVHSTVPIRGKHFSVDPIFEGTSYSQRYSILCQRLVLERLYDATCLTLATKSVPTTVTHPSATADFQTFTAQLQGHVSGFVRSRRE